MLKGERVPVPKVWQDLLPGPVDVVPLHQARGGGEGRQGAGL